MKRVTLYCLRQIGLIVACKSGVTYTNQAGGVLCMQPELEGILCFPFSSGPLRNIEELWTIFSTDAKLSIEKADELEKVLHKWIAPTENFSAKTAAIRVDRSKMKASMEAWIHVKINWKAACISDLQDGFNEESGVITWPNSD